MKDRIKVLKSRQENLISKTSKVCNGANTGRNLPSYYSSIGNERDASRSTDMNSSESKKLPQKVVGCGEASTKLKVISVNPWNAGPSSPRLSIEKMIKGFVTQRDNVNVKNIINSGLQTPSYDDEDKENIPSYAQKRENSSSSKKSLDRFLTQRHSNV